MEVEYEQIRTALLAGEKIGPVHPEKLHFVESELVEDYLEGSLSAYESGLFRSKYLVTDERKDLLNEIRLLKRVSSDAFAFDASVFDARLPLDSKRSRVSRSVLLIAIAAFLLAAVIIVLFFRS